jgi:hypothetical protein
MEQRNDGGRARRQQRAVRTRIGAAVAAGIGFGAAVAGFAVHDHAAGDTTTTDVSTTGSATTPDTTAPDVRSTDPFSDGQLGATPGFSADGGAPDSTSRGS